MKKYLSVAVCILLMLSLLPASAGAGMTCYTADEMTLSYASDGVFAPTLSNAATATFVAPGEGTVVIPKTTASASDGDGFTLSILKEGNPVDSYTVNGGEKLSLPETELHVGAGDTITFSADTRAQDNDTLKWNVSVLYQGTVAAATAKTPVSFVDLNNHWAKSYVLPLAEEGIIQGKSAGVFDPDGQITRAEFLTLALKVAELPAEIYEPSYADVSENQWFAKTAYAAKRGALVDENMTPDNALLPDAPILREEMTAVIMRVIDVMRGKTVDATQNFTDAAQFSAWASDYIGKAANLGIVTGNPDGSFNPRGNATRAEAAVIFSRLKDLLDNSEAYTPAGEYSPVYDAVVYEGVDLNKMINDAYASGQKEITIEPGAYRLKATSKGGHIYLNGVKDFTINGYGVTLLLQSNVAPAFKLVDCENVTINGFSNDHDERVMFQGQIYNIDPDGFYFDIAIDPGYQIESKKLITTGMMGAIYDRETGCQVEGTTTVTVDPKQIEQLSASTFRINGKKTAGQPGIEVGDYLGTWGQNVSSAYSLNRCKGTTLRDINIWSGMCVITDVYGEGDSHFYNVKATYGPRPLGTITDRIVAVHGDGLHTTGNRVGPKMENCTFEHLLDDGTNIHGCYAKVYEISGNKVILGLGTEQRLYWPGDNLRFYSPTTEENSNLNVKTCEELDSYTPKVDLSQTMGAANFRAYRYFAVTLENGDRNFKVGDWVINRDWTSSDFYFKNCTFRDSRSRALLVKSSNGLIENCTISNGAAYGLWLAPEFDWQESGYSENVTIRNCTFHSSGWLYADSAGLTVSGGRGIGSDHHNIVVENCTFYGNHKNDLYMSEGTDFVIRNNRFLSDTDYNAPVTIHLDNAKDITVSGNTYDAGRPTDVVYNDTVTNVKIS